MYFSIHVHLIWLFSALKLNHSLSDHARLHDITIAVNTSKIADFRVTAGTPFFSEKYTRVHNLGALYTSDIFDSNIIYRSRIIFQFFKHYLFFFPFFFSFFFLSKYIKYLKDFFLVTQFLALTRPNPWSMAMCLVWQSVLFGNCWNWFPFLLRDVQLILGGVGAGSFF